ncbi:MULTISPECIES: peptidoglycan-binding domain-containing protein [Variovorax]|uniref:Peptidoglycan-binding protein n=1 Tax=Variovorax paradoxus TaxID=34073 RepID=A0A5Q0LX53_VARPD|nr:MULTISPECIES: peptidoglycan-binding domain-containing protein [Variovorax]QFZ82010.1 peptidoglycan-binding protein [Variovorax paradoxus]WPG38302.1 peptidoglycan-binding domain-containing protein [Variovorax boronicumulans]
MAFSTPFIGKTGNSLIAYNIDWSVGQIGANTREDVMLVQALLKIFYYELLGFNHDHDPPPGETAVIEVDGLKGPITQRHITHFQEQLIARGSHLVPDGIFDPFRKPGAVTTQTKSRYALDLLNNGCANACAEQNVDYYTNLPNRTDMPPLLRSALKRVKKSANKYTYVAVTVPATGGA